MKWLDRKMKAYEEEAAGTFEKMFDEHLANPQAYQATMQNIVQGAQGHYDPNMATLLGGQATADYLAAPQHEQLRQQQVMQERGRHMQELWATGLDAELTITAAQPTGVTLAGQTEFLIDVQVGGFSEVYTAQLTHVVPPPMQGDYVVGAKFHGKVNPQNRDDLALFEKLSA